MSKTIELEPPVVEPREREREHEYRDRNGCHLTADGATTLCGVAYRSGTVCLSTSAPEIREDPCTCMRQRCPACKAIWFG